MCFFLQYLQTRVVSSPIYPRQRQPEGYFSLPNWMVHRQYQHHWLNEKRTARFPAPLFCKDKHRDAVFAVDSKGDFLHENDEKQKNRPVSLEAS